MRLALVTSYFNPCNYVRLRENYFRFVDGLRHHADRLTTVVLVLDDDPIDVEGSRVLHFHGRRPQHVLWQKERLLNAAIESLDPSYDAVAWIDADVLFSDTGWVERAEIMLEQFPVVQLFQWCEHLNADGSLERRRKGIVCEYEPRHSAWGMAWAARRSLVSGGLLDWLITGAGDAWMADAWFGRARAHVRGSRAMLEQYAIWAKDQHSRTLGRVGWIEGTVRHLFHGTHRDRRYQYRNQLLVRHSFDPRKHLVADGSLYRWSDTAKQLQANVVNWFSGRNEDVGL